MSVFPDFFHDRTSDVVRIVNDLVARGYDGGISIEPHLSVVFHDDSVESKADIRYNNYVEYGRRMDKIMKDAQAAVL